MTTIAQRPFHWRDPAMWGLGLGFLLLYGPVFPELVSDWMRGSDYTHGFVIPLITAWFLYARRNFFARAPIEPRLSGLLLLGFALGQFWLGVAAMEYFLQRTSMIPFLLGWILTVWGYRAFRIAFFPIGVLVFMIPPPSLVWKEIAFPLQLLASQGAETLLGWFGVAAVRAGNVIHLPNCSLEVAQACSGLRSLVTLMALGAVIGEGTLLPGELPRKRTSQWIIFLTAIPVAVVVNSVRVALTAVAAAKVGERVVEGWIHEASGLAMFVLALVILLLWRSVVGWIEAKRLASSPAR